MTRTRHAGPRYQLRLATGTDIALGPGKIELLEAIDRQGSIAAACRDMRLSYKKAWQLLDTMNRHFDAPVIATSSGGNQRGGASLTPLGHRLVDHYRALQESLNEHPDAQALMSLLATRTEASP